MTTEFKVSRIVEMTRLSEEGGIERYYKHHIITKGGTRLTVDIDEKSFTAEKATPILLKKAIEADKILGL